MGVLQTYRHRFDDWIKVKEWHNGVKKSHLHLGSLFNDERCWDCTNESAEWVSLKPLCSVEGGLVDIGSEGWIPLNIIFNFKGN